jgi:iron complex outermembrane recepter protein
MTKLNYLTSALVGSASVLALTTSAFAADFNIPGGDLEAALNAYTAQAGVQLIVSDTAVRGTRTRGVQGELTASVALSRILEGTGFATRVTPAGVIAVVHVEHTAGLPAARLPDATSFRVAAAAAAAGIESVVVTSSKIKGDIQTVPIAITALSQEQLTSRQIAGGPDLIKEVPNLTFSKTNFSGYNIEIRGIGTQAISVATDPAVAVSFNDMPFIRNHFFEQEFYDVSQVEVLRGPQGTLYGRNATAGVVNVISAKPTDQFEAMLSADWGNYLNRRYEGMVNIPVVDDRLDIRVAGEWTKRNGYSINDITNRPIDGRDLWSSRVTVGWKPTSDIQTYLVWEHFQENDDRMRSGKQLCTPVPVPATFEGVVTGLGIIGHNGDWLSQGCSDASLYSPNAFGVPDGTTLPVWTGLSGAKNGIQNGDFGGVGSDNPYLGTTQSRNLRVISTELEPTYKAKNDTLEFNAQWQISPALNFSSETGYNHDFLWSTEDYNRFATTPGVYNLSLNAPGNPGGFGVQDPGIDAGNNTFCDPQLGCSSRFEAEDLSDEHAWQLSQEFRLASNFSGPINFSFGGNYLHYETEENYYVFINALTLISLSNVMNAYTNFFNNSGPPVPPYQAGVFDNSWCLKQPHQYTHGGGDTLQCGYIDPNPLTSLNNQGHNYFLSQNPYVLNSYAGFGEVYYNVTPDFKLTAGARWTDDRKHFLSIPSQVLTPGYGYPVAGAIDQQWNQWTGRLVANWTPKLSFTDQTLVYLSAAHGYKAGGANPPGAELLSYFSGADTTNPIHPPTFRPEFIQAFELGTKNTLLDGSLTLNGDVFYYNYTGYQISRIVDRSAINDNFNAHIEGAEFEANWEPLPGLKFSLAQGFEDARLNRGAKSVDLLDRTAGMPGWIVVRPFVTQASNCILPDYVILASLAGGGGFNDHGHLITGACVNAYNAHIDPITKAGYVSNPPGYTENETTPTGSEYGVQYPGFDPLSVDPLAPANVNDGLGLPPNNGQGFDKNLSHHNLPNAPHLTTSVTAEYTMPVSENWAATLHGDFYWQSQQWARVFADPIDKIRPYSTTNLALILTSGDGWQVMGYVKNIFDVTALTGTFLNSDDTDLTTNVFLTDPRLFGIRVTKHFDQGGGFWGNSSDDTPGGIPPLWVEFGGQFDLLNDSQQKIDPPFFAKVADAGFDSPLSFEKAPKIGVEENAKISFTPDGGDWVLSASIRYGRSGTKAYKHQQTNNPALGPLVGAFDTNARFHYAETTTSNSNTHEIYDFMIGKEVGLGSLGMSGTSVVSGGMRFAQFRSRSDLTVYSDPDYLNPNTKYHFGGPKYFHNFDAKAHNRMSFTGIGPAISWDASMPVSGDAADGQITFDWGLNGAVLFGRQKSKGHHETKGKLSTGLASVPQIGLYYHTTHYTHGGPHDRSRSVTVPNLGASAGFSFKYQNAKVSFGYRIDEFFGAMDGGVDAHKSYNFGNSGPFVNLSLGLGG